MTEFNLKPGGVCYVQKTGAIADLAALLAKYKAEEHAALVWALNALPKRAKAEREEHISTLERLKDSCAEIPTEQRFCVDCVFCAINTEGEKMCHRGRTMRDTSPITGEVSHPRWNSSQPTCECERSSRGRCSYEGGSFLPRPREFAIPDARRDNPKTKTLPPVFQEPMPPAFAPVPWGRVVLSVGAVVGVLVVLLPLLYSLLKGCGQ